MGFILFLAALWGVSYYAAKKRVADSKRINALESSPMLPLLPEHKPKEVPVGKATPPWLADMTLADRIEAADDPHAKGGFVQPKGECATQICFAPENPSPNPQGGKPVRGMASNPIRQWCYVVKDTDTAGRIAENHTGDRSRYVELLAANPSKKMIFSPEINFADMCVGERLYIPKSWNPWIDQEGNVAGPHGAYPPYAALPAYPPLEPNVVSAGYFPWPIENPTTWVPIPFKLPGV